MRKVTYPIHVNLNEIPDEGRTFHYSNDSAELTDTLQDLVGSHPYRAEVRLKPIGNVYEISGDIDTQVTSACSRCGQDFDQDFKHHFHELIVIEKERPRRTRRGHVNHSENQDSGPFCNYRQDNNFNVAEFVHEQIASHEAYATACGKPSCEELLKKYQPTQEETLKGESPFAVLKNLKPH
jgi:uncharacterized metal-binding protein YceD (DUF177 family)